MTWDWLIAVHKWLLGINIDTRVSVAVALTWAVAIVALVFSGNRRKEWATITLHILLALAATYALVRHLVQLRGQQDTIVVGLLLVTTVGGIIATLHNIRRAKRLRALMTAVATTSAVSAACLISANLYRNGLQAYFLGGGAERVNWLAAVFVMFVVVPAAAATGVLWVWRKWRKPYPTSE